MLLTIGMIMITRLSYDWSIRQFKIMIAGTVLALVIPVIIRKIMVITRMAWAYTFVGIGLLALVLVAASVTNGAKLSLSIGGFSFQPLIREIILCSPWPASDRGRISKGL